MSAGEEARCKKWLQPLSGAVNNTIFTYSVNQTTVSSRAKRGIEVFARTNRVASVSKHLGNL